MDERRNLIVWFFASLAALLAIGSLTVGVLLNHASTEQIQQERVRNTRAACLDLNARHDAALKVTYQLLAHPAVPPSRKLTVEQTQKRNDALNRWIGALVPKRDCDALVLKSIKGVNK
jgi:hypothetical protein